MSISNPRIEVRDAAAGGWFGAREERALPVRVDGRARGVDSTGSREDAPAKTAARAWLRRGRRALLDLAIVVAALTAVPVLCVTRADGAFWRPWMAVENFRTHAASVEVFRPFTVAADPSITPIEAGRSFAALQQARGSAAFPIQDVGSIEAAWRFLEISPSMFGNAHPVSLFGPGTSAVLEAAGKGLTRDETELLRKVAAAPAWREFDRVARAPSMDMIGARFRLPFTPEATYAAMPTIRFGGTKEIAYAAVARAAYYVAIGQRDSAEAVLRSIVSFGFALIDNSTQMLDQVTGQSIVGIGSNALARFYVSTHDPRVAAVQAALPSASRGAALTRAYDPQTVEQMRGVLLERAADPHELRAVRYESLKLLTASSCTNVRELLFGQRTDVRDAFEQVRRDLARTPTDRALFDLMRRSAPTTFDAGIQESSTMRRLLVGSATIAGAVLHNSRLASCTWLTTGGTFNY